MNDLTKLKEKRKDLRTQPGEESQHLNASKTMRNPHERLKTGMSTILVSAVQGSSHCLELL